jgi:predicted ABC-type ATPase
VRPQLWIVAGPNGAGKSTLTGKYLRHRVPIVDPDEIARRLNPTDPSLSTVALQAGRLASAERTRMLHSNLSFAVETTLTGRGPRILMRQASAIGFKVNLIYIGLHDVALSLGRVRQRIDDGGHSVPFADIHRRYPRSLANLAEALALTDRAFVLDGSGSRRRLLLSRADGRVKWSAATWPDWAASAIPVALRDRTLEPK